MKLTTNLGLKKPDLNDYVNVNDLNENSDKIDIEIKTLQDNKASKTDLTNLETEVSSHLADYAIFKEDTKTTIGLEILPTAAQTLKGAITEVFTNGNNVKSNTVDALLSVDDTLPITNSSAWSDIITQIGNISTEPELIAGDDLLLYQDLSSRDGAGTTPTKVKEIVINKTGSIRLTFRFQAIYEGNGGWINYKSQVYKNGIPIADSEFGYPYYSPNPTEYTKDLDVVEGDFIQVYAWTGTENTLYRTRISNVVVKIKSDYSYFVTKRL